MSGFPLLDPPVHLVEKIIAKTEPKSNYRLRQTCRPVSDLIQASPYLEAHVTTVFSVEFKEPFTFQMVHVIYEKYQIDLIGFDACYGTRLESIFLPNSINEEKYNLLYEMLKKNRITCERVLVGDGYSIEQLTALLNLLKPIDIRFNLDLDNASIDAVFNSKTLKRVDACVVADKVVETMSKLFSRFSNVEVGSHMAPGRFDLLRDVLQAFVSLPTANIKSFRFYLVVRIYTNLQEVNQEFPNLEWTRKLEETKDFWKEEISANFDLPAHFPRGSSCKICVESDDDPSEVLYKIDYKAGENSA